MYFLNGDMINNGSEELYKIQPSLTNIVCKIKYYNTQ